MGERDSLLRAEDTCQQLLCPVGEQQGSLCGKAHKPFRMYPESGQNWLRYSWTGTKLNESGVPIPCLWLWSLWAVLTRCPLGGLQPQGSWEGLWSQEVTCVSSATKIHRLLGWGQVSAMGSEGTPAHHILPMTHQTLARMGSCYRR